MSEKPTVTSGSKLERPRPRCFLALPVSSEFRRVREVVEDSAKSAGFKIVSAEEMAGKNVPVREVIVGELARADCVVADITGLNPNVLVEIGLAQAMGKTVFLLTQVDKHGDDLTSRVPTTLQVQVLIPYEAAPKGLAVLASQLKLELTNYRRSPIRSSTILGRRVRTPFFVDWSRLDRADAENLCRELLAQMGFQRLDWLKESREIDLVAELPKKDPDGYEYRELWLVSMGHNAPMDMVLDMASRHPEFLFDRFLRFTEGMERLLRSGKDIPVTLLFIILEQMPRQALLFDLEERNIRARREGPYPGLLRMRVWDRNYLTTLVQQFPQIGYKYFSDEGRAQAKYRKTPEELYRENVGLTERLTATVTALEGEKNRRVRAERDAVWKDISFSAAHKIGNPIFAIETNLDPLQRRVAEQRTSEANEVISRIRSSIEKAKDIVDQFKSLTRAQEIHARPVALRPLIETSCQTVKDQEIACNIECPDNIKVQGDPDRLAECFDELVRNSITWFDKPQRKLEIAAVAPAVPPLPQGLDSSKRYVALHFRDNGAGVPFENKTKIFDAFFTTQDQGTGLGLALVRRIVEGHGGAIFESGLPGKGADFEIYLPVAEADNGPPKSARSAGQKRD